MEPDHHAETDMIQMTQETRSGWYVVSVRGRADAEAADEMESALKEAVEAHKKVAADFSALDYISSAGLRAVLQAARAAQARNAEFAVCGLSAPVKRVFDMSGLHHVLRIHGELPC
jgi:anti-sigma B factor antagonist